LRAAVSLIDGNEIVYLVTTGVDDVCQENNIMNDSTASINEDLIKQATTAAAATKEE
jgi:hypothetical protein